MRCLAICLLLVVSALASCDDSDCKSCEPYIPSSSGADRQAQLAYEQALAEEFAPVLVFDLAQGVLSHRCFPMDAGYYFEVRKTFPYTPNCEPTCIIENMDYYSIYYGEIPTYYQYAKCHGAEYVIYWWFYGYQPDCGWGSGEHNADWERVVVKIVDGQLDRVLFFQHAGQYTKEASNSELLRFDEDRPVVFVGAISHGSFHDTGGGGEVCCYWRDWRNPGPYPNWKMMLTWRNLVRLSLDEDSPEWMKCETPGCWTNVGNGPLYRNEDLCNLSACIGTDGTCGDGVGDNQQGCGHTDVHGRF